MASALLKGIHMAKKTAVIQHLNVLLRNELTAINQYFLHARMLGHAGFKRLEKKVYEESIDEMKHADMLIARILFLEGLPNLQDLGSLFIGETPKEMLECDLKLEAIAHKSLVEALAACQEAGDNVSEQLVEHILQSEEQHSDWIQTQLRLITSLGEQAYLQTQVHND
jgi:bacterioferritin